MDSLYPIKTQRYACPQSPHSPPCPNSYEAQERFQNDPSVHVALLSITACNMGLNLTSAAIAVFAELHWVPGTVFQV
jgi:hypothetical protein